VSSHLRDFEEMMLYMKMLDPTNAKILEALGRHDPRNILLIAESIGLSHSTVAYRVKKLIKDNGLEINARVDFTKIGLMKGVVIAEAISGKWDVLWKVLESLDSLTYLTKCHGKVYGCYGIFAFPPEHKQELKDYLDEAKRLQAFSNYSFFWITNLCEVPPNFYWFDFKDRRWIFQWTRWIEEIKNASEHLSEKLRDPEIYPIMADETDLWLLRELEKNGTIGFGELAKAVGITPQSVAYRYYKHLIEREIITDHSISIFPYPYKISIVSTFIIEFKDEKALAKFANSLDDKPFILSYAKMIGRNSLIANTYIMKDEFPNFIESLDLLAGMNLIKNFFHVTLTLKPHKRGGVPYQLFKNGIWQYDREENLKRLRKIVR